jgi:histidinol dehydrogenase
MRLAIIHWNAADVAEQSAVLRRPAVAADAGIRDKVAGIIDAVRCGGDAALQGLTRQYDNAEIDALRVSDTEIAAAAGDLEPTAIAAIDVAIRNVTRFHKAQLAAPISVETMPGVRCERVSHAIDAVGLYVPAGTAPLPSAAIMLAVPAAIADCPVRIVCTPPRPDGSADPAVLTAATRAGVSAIYKVGGAQAIAAMAYGTESIPKVNKIFGPGNAWVTCAKALVSADPAGAAIDMPAGPSEVLVLADDAASAEFVAADLLSQAEHGIDSQVLLVTTSERLAVDVQAQVETQLGDLSRSDIAAQSLAHARAIVVDSVEKAIELSNGYAPEHLILQVGEPREVLARIRNAGSVFLGPWTPESVGDYCSGANHVLPTYGYANTYSGLGVEQFQRQMTIQEVSREGLTALGPSVIALATLEGLDGHAVAVSKRLGDAP